MDKATAHYKKYFILFITYTVIIVGSIVALLVSPIDTNITLSIVLILLIAMIGGVFFFRPRIMFHTESIQYYRLKERQGPPLKLKKSPATKDFYDTLRQYNFEPGFSSNEFTIFKWYAKDSKQPVIKRPMLVIYVMIHESSMSFQSPKIIKEINRLENALYKEKKKITNYTVFVVKSGLTLTTDIRNACDYVTFSKVRSRSIININAFYEIQTKSLYFLYSDTFTPNLYYQYGVDLLKKLVK